MLSQKLQKKKKKEKERERQRREEEVNIRIVSMSYIKSAQNELKIKPKVMRS